MASHKRETKRAARLLRDREALKDLRKHFTGYDPADGYSLTPAKIAELPYSKRRALRTKHRKLQDLLKAPFVDFVKPADDVSRKALREFTGERMRNMKHFIVQKPSVDSSVRVVEGNVQLRTEHPGQAAHIERYFMFPKVPRGHKHMLNMFDRMYANMPQGMYVLLTDTYAETGGIVEREQLRGELQRLLEVYDKPKYGEHRFMYRIQGFRWMSTTVRGAQPQLRARDEAREAQREINRQRREALKQELRQTKKRIKRKAK